MCKGFIKLDRSIFEHWIFTDADKFRAFVDLIQLARWKDEKLLIGNEVIVIPRGSYYTSELKLADRWGWSRNKTREFLNLLESEKMILKESTSKGTTITVENYRVYQDEGTTESTSKEHQKNIKKTSKGTSKKHQKNNERYTKEEREEIKESKEGEEGEEVPTLLPLSFPSHAHKKIYEELGETSYRTWFINSEVEEGEVIKIKAFSKFNKEIIENKFLNNLRAIFEKEVEVIT